MLVLSQIQRSSDETVKLISAVVLARLIGRKTIYRLPQPRENIQTT
jgi:hypothetical protein